MSEYESLRIDLEGIQRYFARQTEVVVAYLFGSVARGRADRLSDVDIAVLLQAGTEERASVDLQLRLMIDLDTFTEREVQVTVLNRAPPLLAYQVIREGKVLFERNRQERIQFEVHATRIYFDVRPMLEHYDRLAIKVIKERADGLAPRQTSHQKTLNAAERLYQRSVDASDR